MISVDEALEQLARHRLELPSESIALEGALGRKLAKSVEARVTLPPYAVSSMDGYAVRSVDLTDGLTDFAVIGEAPAGAPFGGAVGQGQAVRIFTGSHVPEGADHIIIQEDADRDGDSIQLTSLQNAPRHIRKAGIDFAAGDVLLEAGTTLGSAAIATIAAADHAHVDVVRELKIAILANGNELRLPGSDPKGGDVIASNYFGLAALIRGWGGVPVDCGIAEDSIDAICERIEAASDADIIVPVGGASVGDHDHMFAAFTKLGLEPVFRKIAVKPGKPTWFGKLGKQLVLGLPGNPASAYVCAHLFLRELVQGQGRLASGSAVLSADLGANGSRETFLRARFTDHPNGLSQVEVLERQDSSLITPFLEANCLVRRAPAAPALAAGAAVTYLEL